MFRILPWLLVVSVAVAVSGELQATDSTVEEDQKVLVGTWELQTKDEEGNRVILRLTFSTKDKQLWGSLGQVEEKGKGPVKSYEFTVKLLEEDKRRFLSAYGLPFNPPTEKDERVKLPYILTKDKLVLEGGQVYLPFDPISVKGEWKRLAKP